MECKIFIDEGCEERVEVYARERTPLVSEIERLAREDVHELIGYHRGAAYRLEPSEVSCFIADERGAVAMVSGKHYEVRERLYEIEGALGQGFIRINKSCIANIGKILKFEATPLGAIAVVFKCGYRDYVSRRQLKAVKERIGF